MQSESSALVATNNGSCTPAYTGAALMSYAHNVSTLIVTSMMPAATKLTDATKIGRRECGDGGKLFWTGARVFWE